MMLLACTRCGHIEAIPQTLNTVSCGCPLPETSSAMWSVGLTDRKPEVVTSGPHVAVLELSEDLWDVGTVSTATWVGG